MLDRVLAAISILFLIAFLAVLVGFVREPDLTIIIVVVVIMALIDFYLLTKSAPDSKSGPESGSNG